MEEYPSLVEGTGLENREVVQTAQGFESLFLRHLKIWYRGVEQLVARRAHNPKVEGSSPFPATMVPWCSWLTRLPVTQKIAGSSPVGTAIYFGFIAQSVEQGTENPCVAGSIPAGATSKILNSKHYLWGYKKKRLGKAVFICACLFFSSILYLKWW